MNTHTYELTKGDLFRGLLHSLLRNRAIITIAIMFSLLAVMVGMLGDSSKQVPLGTRVGKSALYVVTWLVFFAVIQGFVLFRLVSGRRAKGILGKHTLTVDEDGLTERTEYGETTNRWKDIARIRETAKDIVVHLSSGHYFPVPKRSFASDGEAKGFLEEIRKRSSNEGGNI